MSRNKDIQNPRHDLSADDATHEILSEELSESDPPTNLAEAIRARFAPLGGVELELPPREPMREPPDYE